MVYVGATVQLLRVVCPVAAASARVYCRKADFQFRGGLAFFAPSQWICERSYTA
jgi:hypothetical protein